MTRRLFSVLRVVISGEIYRVRCVSVLSSVAKLVGYACETRSALRCLDAVTEAEFLPAVPTNKNPVFLLVLLVTTLYVMVSYKLATLIDQLPLLPGLAERLAGIVNIAALGVIIVFTSILLLAIILDGAWSALYIYTGNACTGTSGGHVVANLDVRAGRSMVLDFSGALELMRATLSRMKMLADGVVVVDVERGAVDGELDRSAAIVVRRGSRIVAILYENGDSRCSTVTLLCPEAVCSGRSVRVTGIPPGLGLVLFECSDRVVRNVELALLVLLT